MSKQGSRTLRGRRRELIAILPRLRRFALSLTGNPADADDLLQSTVERLLARGLPDDAELMPWSIRVCRNLWIDEIRASKVRRRAGEELAHGEDGMVSGESDALTRLTLREVQAALSALPEEQRAVLELVAVEGHSYREAAEMLEAPIGTVMSRLARGRAALVERCRNPSAASIAKRTTSDE